MYLITFSPGDRIFKQGEMGDCFYMLQSGKVAITQSTFLGGTKELVRLGKGKYFGELALIEDAPRKVQLFMHHSATHSFMYSMTRQQ